MFYGADSYNRFYADPSTLVSASSAGMTAAIAVRAKSEAPPARYWVLRTEIRPCEINSSCIIKKDPCSVESTIVVAISWAASSLVNSSEIKIA